MRAPQQLIVITLMTLLSLLLSSLVIANTTHGTTPATAQIVLTQINDFRIAHGLKPLQLNNAISQLAKNHSLDMAQQTIAFGHGGFSKRTRELYKKFPQARGMAENVAYADIDDTKPLVQSWLNSSGHRRNILGNYNLTGIGIAHDANGRVYITQIFMLERNNASLTL